MRTKTEKPSKASGIRLLALIGLRIGNVIPTHRLIIFRVPQDDRKGAHRYLFIALCIFSTDEEATA